MNAAEIAKSLGGKTIRMCLLENRQVFESAGVKYMEIPMEDGSVYTRIRYGNTLEENDNFWKACSEAFSISAQGDIYCIEGTDFRPDDMPEHKFPCIYNAIELPIMMLLKKVNAISKVSQISGKETGEIVTLENEFIRTFDSLYTDEQIIQFLSQTQDRESMRKFLNSFQESSATQKLKTFLNKDKEAVDRFSR